MSLYALTQPRPCPFCGGTQLQISAVVFRSWFVHCQGCRAVGPEGQTPDRAIIGWNSHHNDSLNQRKQLDMTNIDHSIVGKIWKACRAMRTFTVSEIKRITEIKHRDTVRKYIYLLEKRDYVRIEGKKNSPGAPNIYRVVRTKTVNAPDWSQLRYPQADEAMRREHVRKLKPIKVTAN